MAERGWIQNTAVPRERLLSCRHNPTAVEERLSRVFTAPVDGLNTWVRDVVRQSPLLPPGAGATVPWFDPDGGGRDARLLFLMQDPSEVAAGTGFVSPDNDDPSAANTTLACGAAEIPATGRVHWNVFPHWVNVIKGGKPVDASRPPQSYDAATPAAVAFLGALMSDLLPAVEAVVLLGRQAQRGWQHFIKGDGIVPSRVRIVAECPSCSPQAWNNRDKVTGRRNSEITIETLRSAWAAVV